MAGWSDANAQGTSVGAGSAGGISVAGCVGGTDAATVGISSVGGTSVSVGGISVGVSGVSLGVSCVGGMTVSVSLGTAVG